MKKKLVSLSLSLALVFASTVPAYADELDFESADTTADVTIETSVETPADEDTAETIPQETPAEESTETSVPDETTSVSGETEAVTELPTEEETAPVETEPAVTEEETEQTTVIEVETEEDMPELLATSNVIVNSVQYTLNTSTNTAYVSVTKAELLLLSLNRPFKVLA